MHQKKRNSLIQIVVVLFLFSLSGCTQADKSASTDLIADEARYTADLAFIAKAPRTELDPHHQEVQDLCADRFRSLGFAVELLNYGDGVDVIGTLTGTAQSEQLVIVSAHYDSITGGNGADDNASGVAAVLETARLLAGGKYDRTLVVACWDQEEPAETGSYLYVSREKKNQAQIQVSFVYDEIGFSSEKPDSQSFPTGYEIAYPIEAIKMKANRNRANFILILNDSRSKPFGDAIVNAAGRVNLPTMRIEVDLNGSIPIQLKGSDHASFWGKGYSAIEITDTAGYRNPYQHTNMDTVNTLDNGFSVKVISAVVPAVQNALIPNLN